MIISGETLRVLLEVGVTGDDLIRVYKALEDDYRTHQLAPTPPLATNPLERRRAYDRARKQKLKAASGGIPVEIPVESAECDQEEFHRKAGGIPPESAEIPQSLARVRDITSTSVDNNNLLFLDSAVGTGKPTKEKSDSIRGTRIKPDWVAGADGRAYAASLGFSEAAIDRLEENFRDFWLSKAGSGAVKASWPLTWRMWVRNAADRNPPKPANGTGLLGADDWQ